MTRRLRARVARSWLFYAAAETQTVVLPDGDGVREAPLSSPVEVRPGDRATITYTATPTFPTWHAPPPDPERPDRERVRDRLVDPAGVGDALRFSPVAMTFTVRRARPWTRWNHRRRQEHT